MAPAELAIVLALVSGELGVGPAFAGTAAMMLIIPLQAHLVKRVGWLRSATAARTGAAAAAAAARASESDATHALAASATPKLESTSH